MRNKTFNLVGMLVIVCILFVSILYTFKKEWQEMDKTARSVCLASGYMNYRKVEAKGDGHYTVTCYNKEWRKVDFEM